MGKGLLAVLLAGAMIFDLAACGRTAASTETKAAEAETSKPAGNLPELTTEPLEILMWDISTEDPGKTIMEEAVARFTADYPNITVTQVHAQNDTYKQNLIVSMSAGACPDMYIHWGGGPMAEYYKSGFANDITDMYARYDHPDFIDAAIAQASYDGKLIAVPFGGLSGCDLFYNKTLFAELGIEVPGTLDELEDACDTLVENGYIPFALANASQWTGSMYYMYLVARHSGNDEFDAAYTQEGSFTSDAFIFASDKIRSWVEKGYFPEGFNSLNTDDGQDKQMLYDGTAAMMLHGSWQCSGINADDPKWYAENIGVMRWPVDSEAEAAGIDQTVEVGTAIGNCFSFNCWNEDGSVDQTKLDACYVLTTSYINDDLYSRELLETGTIPSIKGMEKTISDPNMQTVADIFFSASNVQLWYDQYLPASVIEVHKDCMTYLFGLEKDGREIGELQDAAMQAALEEE